MRFVYAIMIGAGWAYLGHEFHWPFAVMFVVVSLTFVIVFYASAVIEDDRKQ